MRDCSNVCSNAAHQPIASESRCTAHEQEDRHGADDHAWATTGGDQERRYSPAVCTGTDVKGIAGRPHPDLVSTSYVERQNLTMRMGMRRFIRLTNGFSKRRKVENLAHAVSLHYMHYNFARPKRRSPRPRTATRPHPLWQPVSATTCGR